MYNILEHKTETADQEYVNIGYKKAKVFYMRLAGMYPGFKTNSLLSWFYCLFVVMYLCFLLGILFINIVRNWGSLLIISELILFSSILVTVAAITVCFLYQRQEITHMLQFIGCGFYKYSEPLSPEQEQVLLRTEHEKEFISIVFSIYVYVGGTVAIILIPFIMLYQADFQYEMTQNETVNRFYPVSVEYPFWNSNYLANFIAGNILQYICFIIVTNAILGSAVSYYYLVTALKNQLTVLALSIKNISSRANMRCKNFNSSLIQQEYKSDNTSYSSVFFQHCLNVCLKENILHHKVLIEYFQSLETYYRFSLLSMFFGATVTTCTTGFNVTIMSSSLDTMGILRNFILLCGILVHTFIFCWFGEQLSHESLLIQEALYLCPWYNADEKFKHSTQIMMIRACKKMNMSAGRVMTTSLNTYTQIMSTSYSYFNLLHVVKSRLS